MNEAPDPGRICFRWCDWNAERLEWAEADSVEAYLEAPRPDWATQRWLNVDGLHPYVILKLKLNLDFHTLAAEDVLNVPQRPKFEPYPNFLFLVARMLIFDDEQLRIEQLSLLHLPQKNLLVTFQENLKKDIFDPVRRRLDNPASRFRTIGTPYLLYALLDSVVDRCFPLMEHYADVLDDLEEECLQNPDTTTQNKIHLVKRELLQIRRTLWPLRDMLRELYADEPATFDDSVKPFLRDVYDHAISVIDQLESHRETATSLHELYMTLVSNRMNEIMKVLTIMASVFIPITFFAGVYGMNFQYIPEMEYRYSYPVFWGGVILVTAALLGYFRWKRWF